MSEPKKIIREIGQPDMSAAYEPITWIYKWYDMTGRPRVELSTAFKDLFRKNFRKN